MKAIDGQLPCVATTPPTILTLLPKLTVPHAACFCFFNRIILKNAHKLSNKSNKINKLKELVPLGVATVVKI